MATACPIDLDPRVVRERVVAEYDRLAREPAGDFHFHNGAAYAVEQLGYDEDELRAVPPRATARFAGVGNPLALGPIAAGAVVLDHACGAGTDLLLAARRAGPAGRAIGVDLTPAMREQAERAAAEAGLGDIVEIRAGDMEDLPVADGSVDVVVSNGVVNLATDKRRVFAEIARVLRRGGRLYLADVVVARDVRDATRSDAELWAACVAGAAQKHELVLLAANVGLEVYGQLLRWSPFTGTSTLDRVSRDLAIASVGIGFRRES